MLAKEWRDARWKFAIGVLAFLVIVAVAPRTSERIRYDTEQEIKMIQREVASPNFGRVPPGTPKEMRPPENYEEQLRNDIQRMHRPEYLAKAAGWEIRDVQAFGNYAVLVPLAGLLGVALVSGEVSRNSVFLLLSRPISRGRILLIKYSVCAACLFAVALVGAVGMILSAYAHGYPPEAVDVGEVFGSAALIWLGSLFVLGVALLASVIFGDVIRTLIATVATMYLVLSGPDLVRGAIQAFFWANSDYDQSFREEMAWVRLFENFRLSNYWGGFDAYTGNTVMAQSFLVCLLTAIPPLLLALWLFQKRAY